MPSDSTRRTFLKTAGLTGLSLAAGTGALSSIPEGGKRRDADQPAVESATGDVDSRMGIELAIATICTDGFGDENFEPAFRIIPQIGITNVEFNVWYPRTVTPEGIQSIRTRSQDRGLRPVCLQGSSFGGHVLKDVTHKLWLMEQARSLGCRRVKFTGSKRGTEGGLEAVIEVLQEIAPAAEEMDVLIAVENHRDNNIENIEDYERIFDAVDSTHVGMCLDTGHFAGAGIRNLDVVERFHDKVNHVDLKDTVEFGTYKTVKYGTGAVDLDAVVSALVDHGYSGYLVIEQAPPLDLDTLIADLRQAKELFSKYER